MGSNGVVKWERLATVDGDAWGSEDGKRVLVKDAIAEQRRKVRRYQPAGKRIVVAPDAADEKSLGGLDLPDQAKKPQLTGTVVAVGKDLKDEVKVGDRVMWGHMMAIQLPKDINGEDRVALRYPDEVITLFDLEDEPWDVLLERVHKRKQEEAFQAAAQKTIDDERAALVAAKE